MRYFEIHYPDSEGNSIHEVLSEEDIQREYWPHWYDAGCKKFGKDYVDAHYSFEDCLEDWIVIHWAMEIMK